MDGSDGDPPLMWDSRFSIEHPTSVVGTVFDEDGGRLWLTDSDGFLASYVAPEMKLYTKTRTCWISNFNDPDWAITNLRGHGLRPQIGASGVVVPCGTNLRLYDRGGILQGNISSTEIVAADYQESPLVPHGEESILCAAPIDGLYYNMSTTGRIIVGGAMNSLYLLDTNHCWSGSVLNSIGSSGTIRSSSVKVLKSAPMNHKVSLMSRMENEVLAAGSGDLGVVSLFDCNMRSPKSIGSFQTHSGGIVSMAVMNNTLVTCGNIVAGECGPSLGMRTVTLPKAQADPSIRVYDIRKQGVVNHITVPSIGRNGPAIFVKYMQYFPHERPILMVGTAMGKLFQVYPDVEHLLASVGSMDLRSGGERAPKVVSYSMSPLLDLLAAADSDGSVHFLSPLRTESVMSLQSTPPPAIAFHSGSPWIFPSSNELSVEYWKQNTDITMKSEADLAAESPPQPFASRPRSSKLHTGSGQSQGTAGGAGSQGAGGSQFGSMMGRNPGPWHLAAYPMSGGGGAGAGGALPSIQDPTPLSEVTLFPSKQMPYNSMLGGLNLGMGLSLLGMSAGHGTTSGSGGAGGGASSATGSTASSGGVVRGNITHVAEESDAVGEAALLRGLGAAVPLGAPGLAQLRPLALTESHRPHEFVWSTTLDKLDSAEVRQDLYNCAHAPTFQLDARAHRLQERLPALHRLSTFASSQTQVKEPHAHLVPAPRLLALERKGSINNRAQDLRFPPNSLLYGGREAVLPADPRLAGLLSRHSIVRRGRAGSEGSESSLSSLQGASDEEELAFEDEEYDRSNKQDDAASVKTAFSLRRNFDLFMSVVSDSSASPDASSGVSESGTGSLLTKKEPNPTVTSFLTGYIPRAYRRPVALSSKQSFFDFDATKFNESPYFGLDECGPNGIINPLLQVLFFMPMLRRTIQAHLCSHPACLFCELRFLFDLLATAPLTQMTQKAAHAQNLVRVLPFVTEVKRSNVLFPTAQRDPVRRLQALLGSVLDCLTADTWADRPEFLVPLRGVLPRELTARERELAELEIREEARGKSRHQLAAAAASSALTFAVGKGNESPASFLPLPGENSAGPRLEALLEQKKVKSKASQLPKLADLLEALPEGCGVPLKSVGEIVGIPTCTATVCEQGHRQVRFLPLFSLDLVFPDVLLAPLPLPLSAHLPAHLKPFYGLSSTSSGPTKGSAAPGGSGSGSTAASFSRSLSLAKAQAHSLVPAGAPAAAAAVAGAAAFADLTFVQVLEASLTGAKKAKAHCMNCKHTINSTITRTVLQLPSNLFLNVCAPVWNEQHQPVRTGAHNLLAGRPGAPWIAPRFAVLDENSFTPSPCLDKDFVKQYEKQDPVPLRVLDYRSSDPAVQARLANVPASRDYHLVGIVVHVSKTHAQQLRREHEDSLAPAQSSHSHPSSHAHAHAHAKSAPAAAGSHPGVTDDSAEEGSLNKYHSVACLRLDTATGQYALPSSNAETTEWFVFNDLRVSRTTEAEALDFSRIWKVPALLLYASRESLEQSHASAAAFLASQPSPTCSDAEWNAYSVKRRAAGFVYPHARPPADSPIYRHTLLPPALAPRLPVHALQQFTRLVPPHVFQLPPSIPRQPLAGDARPRLVAVHDVPRAGSLVAVDAEFVAVCTERARQLPNGRKLVLAPARLAPGRVSVTYGDGSILLDSYISSQEPVVDHLTRFSGILPGDLSVETSSHTLHTFKDVYLKLRALVDGGAVFVGHGLNKDWKELSLAVPPSQVVDTVALYRMDSRRFVSLKFLSSHLLGAAIQSSVHDSCEDALHALELFERYTHVWDGLLLVNDHAVLEKLSRLHSSHSHSSSHAARGGKPFRRVLSTSTSTVSSSAARSAVSGSANSASSSTQPLVSTTTTTTTTSSEGIANLVGLESHASSSASGAGTSSDNVVKSAQMSSETAGSVESLASSLSSSLHVTPTGSPMLGPSVSGSGSQVEAAPASNSGSSNGGGATTSVVTLGNPSIISSSSLGSGTISTIHTSSSSSSSNNNSAIAPATGEEGIRRLIAYVYRLGQALSWSSKFVTDLDPIFLPSPAARGSGSSPSKGSFGGFHSPFGPPSPSAPSSNSETTASTSRPNLRLSSRVLNSISRTSTPTVQVQMAAQFQEQYPGLIELVAEESQTFSELKKPVIHVEKNSSTASGNVIIGNIVTGVVSPSASSAAASAPGGASLDTLADEICEQMGLQTWEAAQSERKASLAASVAGASFTPTPIYSSTTVAVSTDGATPVAAAAGSRNSAFFAQSLAGALSRNNSFGPQF